VVGDVSGNRPQRPRPHRRLIVSSRAHHDHVSSLSRRDIAHDPTRFTLRLDPHHSCTCNAKNLGRLVQRRRAARLLGVRHLALAMRGNRRAARAVPHELETRPRSAAPDIQQDEFRIIGAGEPLKFSQQPAGMDSVDQDKDSRHTPSES
jgi:hypothetical protein